MLAINGDLAKTVEAMITKQCRNCGKELKRGPRESITSFRDRVHCDLECAIAARSKAAGTPQRKCETCGRDIIKRGNESWVDYASRRFCGKICHYRSNPKHQQDNKKTCEECGKEITRKKRESPANYKRRRFCNQECWHRQCSDDEDTDVTFIEPSKWAVDLAVIEHGDCPEFVLEAARHYQAAWNGGRLDPKLAVRAKLRPFMASCPVCGMAAQTKLEAHLCCSDMVPASDEVRDLAELTGGLAGSDPWLDRRWGKQAR